MDLTISSAFGWFQSRAADLRYGYLVYITKRECIIYKIKEDGAAEYHGFILSCDKLNVCRFMHKLDNGKPILLSGSELGQIEVFNVETKQELVQLKQAAKGKITSLDTSSVDTNLFVYGDDKGFIYCQQYGPYSATKLAPDNAHLSVQVVTCSPYNAELICVAYSNLNVTVINIKSKRSNGKGDALWKFRGHRSDIHNIVWPKIKFDGLDLDFYYRRQYAVIQRSQERKNLAVNTQHEQQMQNYVPDEKDETDIIITCSKDKNIRLWNVKTGKFIYCIQIPSPRGHRPGDYIKPFVNLYWPQDEKFKFLSTGINGEIYSWDLKNSDDIKSCFTILGRDNVDATHKRQVFNIVGGDSSGTVYTFSMDRTIKMWSDVWDRPGDEPKWTQPTVAGFVYSIKASPFDPSRLAVSCGDGQILVWQTDSYRARGDKFDFMVLYRTLKDKITAIAWHPREERTLAYATDDGLVGVYNLDDPSQLIKSSSSHVKQVYALAWGPDCSGQTTDDDSIPFRLYSVSGDGDMLMHKFDGKYSSEALDVKALMMATNSETLTRAPRFSDVAITADYKVMAAGTLYGHVLLFRTADLKYLIYLDVHSGMTVNSLAWSPHHQYTLASGASDHHVAITDLKAALEEAEAGGSLVEVKKTTRTLVGHKGKVTDVSWNPVKAGQIASVSLDGTAQLWDAERDLPVANYRGHTGRVLTVCWSSVRMFDEEGECELYSGGEDFSLHAWRASQCKDQCPPEKLPDFCSNNFKKRNNLNKKRIAAKNLRQSQANNGDDLEKLLDLKEQQLRDEAKENGDEASQKSEKRRVVKEPSLQQQVITKPQVDETTKDFFDKVSDQRISEMNHRSNGSSKQRRWKTMLKLSGDITNHDQNFRQIDRFGAWVMSHVHKKFGLKPVSTVRDEVMLFGARPDMLRTLRTEERNLDQIHRKKGESMAFQAYVSLKLWRGEIVDVVREATKRRLLDDHIVNMTMQISKQLWRETNQAYAQQLTEDRNFFRASSVYLIIGKVEEAIQVLVDGYAYRDAITLARLRLGDDHDITKKTIIECGTKMAVNEIIMRLATEFLAGRFASASQQCVSSLLRKAGRSNRELYKEAFLSLPIAQLSDASSGGGSKYTRACLQNSLATADVNWSAAQQGAQFIAHFGFFSRLVILSHELLVGSLVVLSKKQKKLHFGQLYDEHGSGLIDHHHTTQISCKAKLLEIVSRLIEEHRLEYADDGDNLLKQTAQDMFEYIDEEDKLQDDDSYSLKRSALKIAVCFAADNFSSFLVEQSASFEKLSESTRSKAGKLAEKTVEGLRQLEPKVGELVADFLAGEEHIKSYETPSPEEEEVCVKSDAAAEKEEGTRRAAEATSSHKTLSNSVDPSQASHAMSESSVEKGSDVQDSPEKPLSIKKSQLDEPFAKGPPTNGSSEKVHNEEALDKNNSNGTSVEKAASNGHSSDKNLPTNGNSRASYGTSEKTPTANGSSKKKPNVEAGGFTETNIAKTDESARDILSSVEESKKLLLGSGDYPESVKRQTAPSSSSLNSDTLTDSAAVIDEEKTVDSSW